MSETAKQEILLIDLDRCIGCKGACQVACKTAHDIALGPSRSALYTMGPEGTYPDITMYFIPVMCQECEDPACVKVCPTGARYKASSKNADNKAGCYKSPVDGVVRIDKETCIGCQSCVRACPYGATIFNKEMRVADKCDICAERREKGEKPICVLSCPMRAFDFGPIDELRKKYGDCAQLAEMPDPSITHPNVVYKPHRERKEFVPLPVDKFIELQKPRDDMGDIFTDSKDITDPPAGLIKRNKLQMKNKTAAEEMAATRNDLG
jgi:DMSO reductase iron-sulfur subunit